MIISSVGAFLFIYLRHLMIVNFPAIAGSLTIILPTTKN